MAATRRVKGDETGQPGGPPAGLAAAAQPAAQPARSADTAPSPLAQEWRGTAPAGEGPGGAPPDAAACLRERLGEVYRRLEERFGPQAWWPAETAWEVVVGAILTQGVAWRNVERAIANLKAAGALAPQRLVALPAAELEGLIRPAGYFKAKARKLKAFAAHLLERHGGRLDAMLAREPLAALREELLGLYGVGRETADAIMLYAGGRPAFVVDAYTVRILERLGLLPPGGRGYDRVQELFVCALPPDPRLYNQYHALLVELGKAACNRRRPRCGECPLGEACPRVGV